MLCQVLDEDQAEKVRKLELVRLRKLYHQMNDKNEQNNENVKFKQDMLEITQRLGELFPNLNPLGKKIKCNNYELIDNLESDSLKLLQAIKILTGSEIEVQPEIKAKI